MIETFWNFFRLYTADADYLPDFWLTMILLYLNAGLLILTIYIIWCEKSKAETFNLMAMPGSLCSTLLCRCYQFCACRMPETASQAKRLSLILNNAAITNEPCAASYCISLSNSMGNRALTTERHGSAQPQTLVLSLHS